MAVKLDNIALRTITFWETRTGRVLTQEDVREIHANVTAFFRLLHAWDKRAGVQNGHAGGSCDDKERC